MRGSCRFAWAAVVAFFLGWAAGTPDPEVRPPSTTTQEQVRVDTVQPLHYINLLGCQTLVTSPCKTKYAQWIVDPDESHSLAQGANSSLDSLDGALGTGFRLRNVFIDAARHRTETAAQFKAESEHFGEREILDRERYCLPDADFDVCHSGPVIVPLSIDWGFTYEDEDLRPSRIEPALEKELLESMNQRQIRESLRDKSPHGSSAHSTSSVPDVSPAGAR